MRARALVGVGVLGLALSGCSYFGVQVAGPQTPVATPTVTETSPTPTPTPTTATPTPTPTTPTPSAAGVKATGNLNFYSEVSSAMEGTCTRKDGRPVITVTDEANDFFTKVTLTAELAPAKDRLLSFAVETGEDSEEITWHLSYNSSKPAKGTSAKLVVNGSTYRISGNTTAVEIDSDGTKTTEIIPFGATVKCADQEW
ncbi:hypothetical protein ATK74_0533 [Propionicimonas paludicola]|uniref:Lipoprotein antigen n=1 Tax=Propionicimonas paludicola TaxID=185243 RepID=A0A2A9CNU5_9ACTN|nr:hypothetical protein ATK74_0533 [Propionicimonas paludicola]